MDETTTPRISMRTIQEYILSVFNLERGLGFTMWQLTVRPGTAIREFLFTEKRKQYIKPLSFLILMISITTYLLIKSLPEDVETINKELANSPGYISVFMKDFGSFLFKYFNLIQMLKIPFLSIGTYYIFKKSKFNFAEHLVLNSYIFSYVSFFLGLVLLLPEFLMGPIILVIFIANFAYPCYVYFKLFEESVLMIFVKYLGVFWIASVLHTVFVIAGAYLLQQLGLLV